jgi:hypothetical protein
MCVVGGHKDGTGRTGNTSPCGLLITVRTHRQSGCPLVGDRLDDKLWTIQAVGYYLGCRRTERSAKERREHA